MGDRTSLYSYTDQLKNRFYISKINSQKPEELLYQKKFNGTQETTFALYEQQLRTVTVEYGIFSEQVEQLINSINYTSSDLKKLIQKINTKNATPVNRVVKKRVTKGFFISAGLTKNKLSYTGENMVTVDGLKDADREKFTTRTTDNYLPRLSAGVDLFFNPVVKKWIIRMDLSAAQLKSTINSYFKYSVYTNKETNNEYHFSAWNFALTPQVICNLYNANKLKVYLGAGVSINHLFISKNQLVTRQVNDPANETKDEKYFILKKNSLSTIVRSGVRINERIDLSMLWGNKQEYSNYQGGKTSIKGGLLAVAVGFNFGG